MSETPETPVPADADAKPTKREAEPQPSGGTPAAAGGRPAYASAPPPPMPSYVPVASAPPVPAPPPGGFKRGFGLGMGLGTAMLVFGVVISIISAVTLIGAAAALGGAATANTALERTTTIWGNAGAAPENTIRAVSVTGPIQTSGTDGLSLQAMTYGYEVAATLDAMEKNDAAGVLLLIDTPGGTITGSRAIADAVQRYKQRTGNKVIAFVEGTAASGGMMAMAAADEIISDYGTLIGSIGVVFGPITEYKDVVGTSGTILTEGVTTTGGITQEYLSAGEGKDLGNPFREMTDKERAVLMDSINAEYDSFVSWIHTSRDIPEDTIREEIGAYVYGPAAAKKLGLIDQVMGRDDAFAYAAEAMGVDPDAAAVITPAAPDFWMSMLGAEQRIFGQSAPQTDAAQPVVTSVLCTGGPQVMVLYGSLAFCG